MIFTDDTHLMIAGKLIPALVRSIEITGEALVDEEDVEGSKEKLQQVNGYENSKIFIELTLKSNPMPAIDKLRFINDIFKAADQEKPVPILIENEHCSVRGIKQVLFKKLSSKESVNDDLITVSIELLQYNAPKITVISADIPVTNTVSTSTKVSSSPKKTLTTKTENTPATNQLKTTVNGLKIDMARADFKAIHGGKI